MEFIVKIKRNQRFGKLTQCKLALFALIYIISFQVQANEVLKCLGREELRLHKAKNTGPQYQLNQIFLNEIASNNTISIKDEFVADICQNKTIPPSVMLLKNLMLRQRGLFNIKIDPNRIDGFENFKVAQIDDLVARAAKIFFQYLAGLQVISPSAHCLERKLPSLSKLINRYNYLESEMKATDLLKDKREIITIFKGLENLKSIYQICDREKQAEKAKKKSVKK